MVSNTDTHVLSAMNSLTSPEDWYIFSTGKMQII